MKYSFIWLTVMHFPLSAGVTVLTDGDFQLANWTEVSFTQNNGTGTNARVAAGGNPDAFRQMSISTPGGPAGTSVLINIASFGTLLTYNPSVSGEIQQIQLAYDISRVFSSGITASVATGSYRPFVEQDGKRFFLAGVEDAAAVAAWTAFSHISTNPNDWGQINAGVEKPDFSASGGEMTFGYRVLLSLACPAGATGGCGPATAVSGIDNFTVTVTSIDPVGTVPEPSASVLVGAGLIAATLWRIRGLGSRSSR